MAAFTYQHPPPFHLDPLFLPNTPFYMSELILDEAEVDTNIPTFCFPSSSSSSSSSSSVRLPLDDQLQTEKITNTDSSSTIVDNFEGGSIKIISTQEETPMEKKRKNRDGSCSCSVQSKDVNKKAKSKKQKKYCSVGSIQVKEEVKKCTTDYKKNQKKGLDEVEDNPPTGYVHVRARRGEATDSHSLAERVRREKISERLKVLQSLVPGCDKVTSKAHMLDEIINYVQSLQLQVEVLSMKLASVNPLFYDFGVDFDACFMVKSEKPNNLASPMLLPCVQQSIPTTPTDFVDMTTTPPTANNFSASLQQQQQQSPNDFSAQGNGDHHQLWHVGNQRPMLINQLGATNLFSFP